MFLCAVFPCTISSQLPFARAHLPSMVILPPCILDFLAPFDLHSLRVPLTSPFSLLPTPFSPCPLSGRPCRCPRFASLPALCVSSVSESSASFGFPVTTAPFRVSLPGDEHYSDFRSHTTVEIVTTSCRRYRTEVLLAREAQYRLMSKENVKVCCRIEEK